MRETVFSDLIQANSGAFMIQSMVPSWIPVLDQERRTALVKLSCGHSVRIEKNHSIQEDGKVFPSVCCHYRSDNGEYCAAQEWVRLKNWSAA